MNFTTTLNTRDVSIFGLPDNELVENCRFTIKWGVELETREWGIKDFYVIVDEVEGDYDVQIIDGDNEHTETRTFDFEPFREDGITLCVEWDEYSQLQINALEIDLSTNSLEVAS